MLAAARAPARLRRPLLRDGQLEDERRAVALVDSTQIRPPIAASEAAREEEAEARCLAGCARLPRSARKNFVKIRCWSPGAIPTPSSCTRISAVSWRRRPATVIGPPVGENLTALSTRWWSICASLSRSASHGEGVVGDSTSSVKSAVESSASTRATASPIDLAEVGRPRRARASRPRAARRSGGRRRCGSAAPTPRRCSARKVARSGSSKAMSARSRVSAKP